MPEHLMNEIKTDVSWWPESFFVNVRVTYGSLRADKKTSTMTLFNFLHARFLCTPKRTYVICSAVLSREEMPRFLIRF